MGYPLGSAVFHSRTRNKEGGGRTAGQGLYPGGETLRQSFHETRYSSTRGHIARNHFHYVVPSNIDRNKVRTIFEDVVPDPAQCILRVIAFDTGVDHFISLPVGIQHFFEKGGIAYVPIPRKGTRIPHGKHPIDSCGLHICEFNTDESLGIDTNSASTRNVNLKIWNQFKTARCRIVSFIRGPKIPRV